MNKLLLLILTFAYTLNAKNALTYELSNERFGDHLITYIKAKTAAYALKLDFFYRPFKYSDQLVLHDQEIRLDGINISKYGRKVSLANQLVQDNVLATLYISDVMLVMPEIWGSFWDDMYPYVQKYPDLKAELQRLIAPKNVYAQLSLPKDRVTIAVHMRKGGGFDNPPVSEQLYTGHEDTLIYYDQHHIPIDQFKRTKGLYSYGYPVDMRFPIKLPPDQYYIDQIKKIYTVIKAPLHVHIFTDDPDPTILMERVKGAVNISDISYSCRTEGNHHAVHVLEDFFAMLECDCLIMPWSNYSRCVQLIGDFKIIIHPFDGYWDSNRLIIDKLIFIDNRKKYLSLIHG